MIKFNQPKVTSKHSINQSFFLIFSFNTRSNGDKKRDLRKLGVILRDGDISQLTYPIFLMEWYKVCVLCCEAEHCKQHTPSNGHIF